MVLYLQTQLWWSEKSFLLIQNSKYYHNTKFNKPMFIKKNKTLRKLLLVFLGGILLNSGNTYSNELTMKTQIIIQTEAINIIENYENYINLIGKTATLDHEKAKSYAEELIELFINRQVLVYNDLDPSKKLSRYYEIETYVNNILLWYKDGLEVNMWYNDAKVSNIIDQGQNVYTIDVYVPKKINGNYLNKVLNKNNEKLIFRIAFSIENGSPTKYKIAGLRSAEDKGDVVDTKTLEEVNSANFSDSENRNIEKHIITVLNDYINYLNLMVNPQELKEDKVFYKDRFLSIFTDENVYVPNDLEIKPKDKTLPAKDYIDKMPELFPRGINNLTFNLDSAIFGKAIKTEKGNYFSYITVNKFFSGSPDGKKLVRNDNQLIIKVEYDKNDRAFSNFKISSIVLNTNEYSDMNIQQVDVTPELALKENSRKGISLGAFGEFGNHAVLSSDLIDQNINTDYVEWKVETPTQGFSVGGLVHYYPFHKIGFSVGLSYSKYSTSYLLSDSIGFQSEKIVAIEPLGVNANPIVIADYDSVVSVKQVAIPLLANFHYSKAGEIGAFVSLGLSVSYVASSTYKASGSYKNSAMVVDKQMYTVIDGQLQEVDADYKDRLINGVANSTGWEKDKDYTTEGDFDKSNFNVGLVGKIGIEYYIDYFISLNLGFYFEQGIVDIESNKSEYLNIFGESLSHKETITRKKGVFIGVNYKL